MIIGHVVKGLTSIFLFTFKILRIQFIMMAILVNTLAVYSMKVKIKRNIQWFLKEIVG